MPDFRRARAPGGTFFFTVVTYRRRPFLREAKAQRLLRDAVRRCGERWPFSIEAFVLLPDHLHTLWTLPPDDSDYSKRWAWIKKEFTRAWLAQARPNADQRVRLRERRRGVWQARFWEHAVRDEVDFRRHADYIHYNPVRHGLVSCPREWPWSSFHRWVDRGRYPPDWGCPTDTSSPPDLTDLGHTAGEWRQ